MAIMQALTRSLKRASGTANNKAPEGTSPVTDKFNLPPELGQMRKNCRRWLDIYRGDAPWLKSGEPSLRLGTAIPAELARLTTLELRIDAGSGKRAEAINKIFNNLLPKLRIYTEYACACGGVMLKPSFDGKRITVSCILPTDFDILGFDASGAVTSAVFYDRRMHDGKRYLRTEEHRISENGYEIRNTAYAADKRSPSSPFGKRVPLSVVPQWTGLSPLVHISGLHRPLFSYFSMPCGNADFPSSPLGVSVFASSEKLIREADRQFGRLIWEFEGGELAIDASEEIFPLDRSGRPILPKGKERLFRPNITDSSSGSELMRTFSPELRDVSLINGLNRIIMFIEDTAGVARGTFSDPSEMAKTATEIRFMRQRTYTTVHDIQNCLGHALKRLAFAVDAMLTLYRLEEPGAVEMKIDFDDSIIVDSESARERDLGEVKMGLMTADEFRAKWYSACGTIQKSGE